MVAHHAEANPSTHVTRAGSKVDITIEPAQAVAEVILKIEGVEDLDFTTKMMDHHNIEVIEDITQDRVEAEVAFVADQEVEMIDNNHGEVIRAKEVEAIEITIINETNP